MKLFKIFGGLFLLVLILVFLLKNTEEVAIDLILIQYEQVNIAFVMMGTGYRYFDRLWCRSYIYNFK